MEQQQWLAKVPFKEERRATWLDEGRPLWANVTAMGAAIKDSSRDYQSSDLQIAEWLGRGLILLGEQEGDEYLIGLGEIAVGDARRMAGHTADGLAWLDQAAARFDRNGDALGWARTRIGWLGSIFQIENHPPVTAIVERAAAIFEAAQADHFLLPLYYNYAHYLNNMGRVRDSLPWGKRALALAQQISDPHDRYPKEVSILHVLIVACGDLGELEQAQVYVEQGLQLLRQSQEIHPYSTLELLATIGWYFTTINHYNQALYYFFRALDLADTVASRTFIHAEIAACYLAINRLEESAKLLTTLYDEAQTGFNRVSFGSQLLEIYTHLGQWDLAHPLAVALWEWLQQQEHNTSWASRLAQLYARISHQRGDYARSQELVTAAVALSQTMQGELARAYLLRAELEAQPTARQQTLTLARPLCEGIAWLAWQYHWLVSLDSPTLTGQQAALEQAATALDEVQRSLSTSFHATYLEATDRVYHTLIESYLATGDTLLAWQTLERVKSRALLNAMAHQQGDSASTDSSLHAKLQRLQNRHHAVLRQVAAGQTSQEEVQVRLEVIERSITETQQRLEVERMGRQERAAPLDPFTPLAPPNTDLVAYYVGKEEIYALIQTEAGCQQVRLPMSVTEVTQLLEGYFTTNRTVPTMPPAMRGRVLRRTHQLLQQLAEGLFTPLAGSLTHEQVVIVPHRGLHQCPFHLLFWGGQYLFQRYALRVIPTARLMERAAPPASSANHVVVAHTWEGRLPHTLQEGAMVRAITGAANYLQNEAATKAAVSDLLGYSGILHLAAHGAHRPDRPELSHIQLEDGQLTLVDLFQRPLAHTLVTLSACETGRAVIRAGDDPVGLWRGFLAAGVQTLLVTLWQIHDKSAFIFMEQFYRHLRTGLSKSAALRQTQKEWLLTQPEHWHHPFYWGAFQLIGADGIVSFS